MDFEFGGGRSERAEPVQPQLTAMIDVCALLIIFLIAGTVFGASSLILPEGVKLPRSFHYEEVLAAPQVAIGLNGNVKVSFSKANYPSSLFHPAYQNDPRMAQLKNEIMVFLSGMGTGKREDAIINVVADRQAPYSTIYDVIQVFRKNGFQSVLFISESDGQGQ